MVAIGFFIEYLQSFNIRILILSCTWALLGSSLLIISLTFLTEISIDVKTDLIWVVNLVDNWLLWIRGVHYPAKYELKSSHFDLITDINLLLCYISGIEGIFTIQQYF